MASRGSGQKLENPGNHRNHVKRSLTKEITNSVNKKKERQTQK